MLKMAVYFEGEGDTSAIVKANLWLRTADRIKIVVGRFNATTFDELFEQTKALPWESIIDKEGNFPVQALNQHYIGARLSGDN